MRPPLLPMAIGVSLIFGTGCASQPSWVGSDERTELTWGFSGHMCVQNDMPESLTLQDSRGTTWRFVTLPDISEVDGSDTVPGTLTFEASDSASFLADAGWEVRLEPLPERWELVSCDPLMGA